MGEVTKVGPGNGSINAVVRLVLYLSDHVRYFLEHFVPNGAPTTGAQIDCLHHRARNPIGALRPIIHQAFSVQIKTLSVIISYFEVGIPGLSLIEPGSFHRKVRGALSQCRHHIIGQAALGEIYERGVRGQTLRFEVRPTVKLGAQLASGQIV